MLREMARNVSYWSFLNQMMTNFNLSTICPRMRVDFEPIGKAKSGSQQIFLFFSNLSFASMLPFVPQPNALLSTTLISLLSSVSVHQKACPCLVCPCLACAVVPVAKLGLPLLGV
jgi:hypothetical protein